jgi:hypothetical protein
LFLSRDLCHQEQIVLSNLSPTFFGGIAFGTNVFLRCHTDADFTFSIVHVLLKGKSKYLPGDDVVTYFCFPTIGVAVPLCPGDYVLFNAISICFIND